MAKPSLEATTKQGKILRANALFDEALVSLRQAGCRYPISVRDLAVARIEKGKKHSLSQNGSYTREGILYFQDAYPILALSSPLLNLKLVRQAIQANRDGRYFSTQDGEVYEKFARLAEDGKTQEPEKRKAVYLPKINCTLTKTNEDFNRILETLFKETIDDYLQFNGQGIPFYLVGQDTVKAQKGTLLTQMWFGNLGGGSGLDGSRDLYLGCRVRGVLSSERANASEAQKVSYNPKDVNAIKKEIGKLTKILQPSQLKKLNNLVGRLK